VTGRPPALSRPAGRAPFRAGVGGIEKVGQSFEELGFRAGGTCFCVVEGVLGKPTWGPQIGGQPGPLGLAVHAQGFTTGSRAVADGTGRRGIGIW